MAQLQMNTEQFISEVILPEATRLGVTVEADLYKRHGDSCDFALLYEVSGERRVTPMLVDVAALNDSASGTELVHKYLVGIKQIIDSGGSMTPDGWTTYRGKH